MKDLTRQRPVLTGLMIWTLAALVGAGFFLLGVAYTNHTKDTAVRAALARQYRSSEAACHRGNTIRLRINTLLMRANRSDLVLPLIDCATAYTKP